MRQKEYRSAQFLHFHILFLMSIEHLNVSFNSSSLIKNELLQLSQMLMTGAIKLHHKELAESCERTLVAVLGYDETKTVMMSTILQLSETDPDSFRWISKQFRKSPTWLDLKETVVMMTINKLLNQGYVLGKDFSIAKDTTILVSASLKTQLSQATSTSEQLFLDEILSVSQTA